MKTHIDGWAIWPTIWFLNGPLDGMSIVHKLCRARRSLHCFSHELISTVRDNELWRYDLKQVAKPNRHAMCGEVLHHAYVGECIGEGAKAPPVFPPPFVPSDFELNDFDDVPDGLRSVFNAQQGWGE